MLFRTAFWIGVVALLMPHAPAVGAPPEPSSIGASPGKAAAFGGFRDALLDRLVALRADIEAAERARGGR